MSAALKQWRLLLVGSLIVVVPEFVINNAKFVVGLLDAHLDTQVIAAIKTPGAGVANNFAIARLGELRARPKRIR